MDSITIVGCGTVGASLSYMLARANAVDKLILYDYDIVSDFNDIPAYPFLLGEGGLEKVKVVEFHSRYINSDLIVETHESRVNKPFRDDEFVIDCRDLKSDDINANVRISLDGYMLYIDSMIYDDSTECDYHRYMYPKDSKFIESAMSIVLKYLNKNEYRMKDFRFYNLKDKSKHILSEENFYDCM